MPYILTVGWSECLVVVLVWLAGWPVGLAGLVGMEWHWHWHLHWHWHWHQPAHQVTKPTNQPVIPNK